MHNPDPVTGSTTVSDTPGKSVRCRRIVTALVVIGAAGVGIVLWSKLHSPSNKPITEDNDEVIVPAAVNPGFVGIEACAECHAQRVLEFKGTRHFKACVPATGAAAPGFSAGKGFHPTRVPGLTFEMSRSGNELFATGVQTTPQGEERVRYQIGLVYGADGKRDEMYFAWQDDRLIQLPVAWLHPLGRWGNIEDRMHGREALPNCIECHNTWVANVPGTNQYRRADMLLGVTCERCHGPGHEHVAYHQAHPKDKAHAVVHPGNLARERLMDVCAQCHSNVKRRGPPFSYRPGEALEKHYRTIEPKFADDDIVGNQVRQLRASRCFEKSQMTCITCHNPHRPQQAAAVQRACLQCHTAASCTEQPRLPAPVRAACTGCHMPPRVWMNVHFHTAEDQYVPVAPRTEHRIGVYLSAKQAVMLAWLRTQGDPTSRAEAARIGSELVNFWLQEADRRRRHGRLKAAIGAVREAIQANPIAPPRPRLWEAIAQQTGFETLQKSVDLRHPEAAIERLQKVLKIRPDDALAHSKLGNAYASLGQHDEAVAHLRAVAQHDPDDASGLVMLAWMAYVDGQFEEALAYSAKAAAIEPYSATIHYQWGLALLKLERWSDATAQFRRALTIQPRHEEARRGLRDALQAEN
jgi:predicted CXXCH cytochrome family protein